MASKNQKQCRLTKVAGLRVFKNIKFVVRSELKHAGGVLVELVLYRPVGYNALNTHDIGPYVAEFLYIALKSNL